MYVSNSDHAEEQGLCAKASFQISRKAQMTGRLRSHFILQSAQLRTQTIWSTQKKTSLVPGLSLGILNTSKSGLNWKAQTDLS